jgi:Ran GTPase-activating protein (RanGAP) involved in mRNA processing and transport
MLRPIEWEGDCNDNLGCFQLSHQLGTINDLKSQNLSKNLLGDEGAFALAKVIEKSTTIGVLNLASNDLSPSGCGAIFRSL